MRRPTVALFLMTGYGHFARLYGLIRALSDGGVDACVFTESIFESRVRAAGGRFFDLYAGGRSTEALDSSRPRPVRNVTFAAVHADEIAAEVAAVRPSVIVADSHAVVGLAVANVLGLPYVCVRPGHDVHPAAFVEAAQRDLRLDLRERCFEAAEVLRDRYGIADASPFSYSTALSPLLNIYCEPEPFISDETRAALEPVVFFGSLRPLDELGPLRRRSGGNANLHAYVSFGTVVWAYWAERSLSAIEQIAGVIAARPGMSATISLGGADLGDEAIDRLRRPGIAVERWVDQWQVLAGSDVFFTHHGLNSTHEAIYHLVPMLSYPYQNDQPLLAVKSRQLGLALPLGAGLGPPLERDQIDGALDAFLASRAELLDAHDRARRWEIETIERRPEVVRRIVELA